MSQSLATAFLGMFMVFAMLSAANADDDKPPAFKITTNRKDDTVEVKIEKDKALFSIRSPFGISQATIERRAEKWPDSVAIRLHLKGLSNFRASNGKITLDAAVGIRDGKARFRVWKDGKEDSPLDPKSLYWIEIQLVGADGKPGKDIPLKSGYFELDLPRMLFESSPKAITVNWIDFYRN